MSDTIVIAAVDVCAAGVRLLLSAKGATPAHSIPLDLPDAAPVVSTRDLSDHFLVGECSCTTSDGATATLIIVNVQTDESSYVAHRVVSMLQQRPNVRRVVLLGALHLPASRTDAVYCAALNGCDSPSHAGLLQLPDDTAIGVSMLAALHHWLLVSGLPTQLLVMPGYRPSAEDFSDDRRLPIKGLQPLVEALHAVCGIEVDLSRLEQLRICKGWPLPSHTTAKLDLMYT